MRVGVSARVCVCVCRRVDGSITSFSHKLVFIMSAFYHFTTCITERLRVYCTVACMDFVIRLWILNISVVFDLVDPPFSTYIF